MGINKKKAYKTRRRFCILTAIILLVICGLILSISKISVKKGNKSIILSVFASPNNNNNKGMEEGSIGRKPSITPSTLVTTTPSITPSPSPVSNTSGDSNNKEADKQASVAGIKDYSENDVKLSAIDENYKNFYKNDLFIGDSITDELSSDDLLDDINVCSKLGLNLLKAKAQIDTANISNPRNIYILLGLNDLTEDTLTTETFTSQYTDMINYLKNKYPNSKIYVQSILPVTAEATEKTPCINNERIGEFNIALKNMTVQENIMYMDLTSLIDTTNSETFESDGEHPNYKFDPVWLTYIENNIKTN